MTTKADVYAMGVVLLNVLFDWRQIIMTLARLNNTQVSLSAWIKRNIRDRTLLLFMYPYIAGKVASECLVEILDIAFCCLMKSRYDRPKIALKLQTNHNWGLFDDEVNALEAALQIQLQTNQNWSLDQEDDDLIRMTWSLTDDVRMKNWNSNNYNTEMRIPNFDFESIEIVR